MKMTRKSMVAAVLIMAIIGWLLGYLFHIIFPDFEKPIYYIVTIVGISCSGGGLLYSAWLKFRK